MKKKNISHIKKKHSLLNIYKHRFLLYNKLNKNHGG